MRRLVAAVLALHLIGGGAPEARDEPISGWFDLQVPGGASTLAALGISLEERALTLPILARALFDRDQRLGIVEERLASVVATAQAADSDEAIAIPVPLEASIWRDLLPTPAPPAPRDLFLQIITNRDAALVAYGLMSAHPSLREWLARDRDLLRFIHRQAAGPFALVARRLERAGDRLVLPGGPRAAEIWRALAGVPPARTGEFLRALLTKDDGRLAWYYDTIGGLPAETLAVAWPETGSQIEQAIALYQPFRQSDPQWRIREQPFRRGVNDAWMVVTQVEVQGGGIVSPLPLSAWELLFRTARPTAAQVQRALEEAPAPLSMAWLAREVLSNLVRERRFRFESVRLAQRVFAAVDRTDLPAVVAALSGLRDVRALLFSLERMQVTDAQVWLMAVDAARHVSNDATDSRVALPAFQATLALIERMRHVGTLDAAEASRLIRSLSAAVRANRRVVPLLRDWILSTLLHAVSRPAAPDASIPDEPFEATMLQALAGPVTRETRALEWEGLSYVVDIVAAEHDRLRRMRALLPGVPLDAALAADGGGDLVESLTALVYATALGDPDGPASLSPEVVSRHDFGLAGTSVIREELPWAPPEERQGYGPWRVQGSLLSLDHGLSRLFLRRVADQQMPGAPSLTLNDFGTLTRTPVAMLAGELTDAHRDGIAAAIARGRERVMGAQTVADLDALARECGMSATTRQLLPWIVSRQREEAAGFFALRDLMWLGQPPLAPPELDRWGVAADSLDGRRVLAMPRPAPWEDYAGRSEAGLVASQAPDLTLRLVEETAVLRLPASLLPSLLAFALQDYWHDVQARFADDWLQLTREAARLSSTRIQDYVAALTGDGPLRTQ